MSTTLSMIDRYLGMKIFHLPGDSSETGVLEGVGLCPGGRKCDGDPLFEPPPPDEMKKCLSLIHKLI